MKIFCTLITLFYIFKWENIADINIFWRPWAPHTWYICTRSNSVFDVFRCSQYGSEMFWCVFMKTVLCLWEYGESILRKKVVSLDFSVLWSQSECLTLSRRVMQYSVICEMQYSVIFNLLLKCYMCSRKKTYLNMLSISLFILYWRNVSGFLKKRFFSSISRVFESGIWYFPLSNVVKDLKLL